MVTTPPQNAHPPRAPSLLRALALLFLAAVVFATLYPWSDWRLREPGALTFLGTGLPRYWTWFDLASNVLAYLLLGLLLTAGWLGRLRQDVALAVTLVGCSLLSLSLETLQSWLPGRVPSLLDWLANTVGAAAGAWLGTELNRARQQAERVALPVRERWYEQGTPAGWTLLILWLAAQLVPQRLLFATGNLRRVLDQLAGALLSADELAALPALPSLPAAHGVLVEAATTVCAVCAIGILALDLVQGSRRRVLLLVSVGAVALTLRSIATQMVYGAGAPLAWLTPGAQGGLVVGVLLLYAFATLGARARAASAALLTIAALALVNVAPADRYFETTMAGLHAGQLVNLHGLLRAVSLVWPFAAIAYFWRRSGRGSARRA